MEERKTTSSELQAATRNCLVIVDSTVRKLWQKVVERKGQPSPKEGEGRGR